MKDQRLHQRTTWNRSLPGSRAGLGGFQESMLAMMVVTAGVVVLTFALALVGPSPPDVVDDDQARRALERIVTDPRWTTVPGVLRETELDEISAEPSGPVLRGCRAVLQEIGGDTIELFAEGDCTGSGERWAASRAVNIYRGPQDVSAGTLTVWVWT